MLTITQDVDLKLKDYLARIAPERSVWRAIACHQPTKLSVATATNLKAVVSGIVVQHCAGQTGAVFIFGDQDILVLCRAAARKNLADLARDFNTFFAAPPYDKQDICRLYDLGIAYDAFETWCNGKIVPEKTATACSIPPSDKAVAASQIILDKNFTDQIPARRAKRKETVVLLVEDDPLSMRLARRTLISNYSVVTAQDGAAAREAYAINAPTMTFLDIGLPDTSGHDVLKALQAMDPSAYVVMLSANSYQQDIIKAMQAGAKGFICKPFTAAKLSHYIAQAEQYHAGATPG